MLNHPKYNRFLLDCLYEHQLFHENQARLRELLEGRGMKFIEADQLSFQQMGSGAVYQSLSREMKDIYNRIQAIE